MTDKHKELQEIAIRWLYGVGCSVFAKEVPTKNGNADALGIRTRGKREVVYYLEAKVSKGDLNSEKQKMVYRTSIGDIEAWCGYHNPNYYRGLARSAGWESCAECLDAKSHIGDTGIDFYYLIISNNLKIPDDLYRGWGVINEEGRIIRKAKRMRREFDTKHLMESISHVLVYKVYGRLYIL